MKLQFDKNGCLEPYDIILTDLDILEASLVTNEYRRMIFEDYLMFLENLKQLGIGTFYQWIDGSFVTKKYKPNDIDVVTFIEYQAFNKREKLFSELYWNRKQSKVDSCFVRVYPDDHEFSIRTKYDQVEYLHDFTRDNRNKLEKGIIQINF